MIDELELRGILQQLQELIPISSIDISQQGFRFTATVISEAFARMDEATRQQVVWGHLLKRLSDEDRAQVDFVFTLTPDEALAR